jgi:hypothetical protein
MTTLAQANADLGAAPRPVLFLDTCALLDIVRAPLRDLTMTVRAGVDLRTLAAAGTVRLFVQLASRLSSRLSSASCSLISL